MRAIIASLAVVVLLSGCATRPEWPSDNRHSNHSLEQKQLLASVPFFPQERYQCGPASLAMMLNSQGLSTSPEALKEQVYLPERHGTLQVELVAAGRNHGMVAYQLDDSLQSLLTEVAAGNPVLVMQNLRLNWWPQWHFAVVIGFDAAQRNLILHTDTRANHAEPLETFMATWNRADNWSLVMLPPDRLPATAAPMEYLRSVNDLETTGQLQTAARAYRTAEQAWPDQPAAIMGQGNVAWQQSDWRGAARHYLRLTTAFPDLVAGWNNLAYALRKLECNSQANKAASCANSLAPGAFTWESGAPAASGHTPDSQACPVIQCPLPDH